MIVEAKEFEDLKTCHNISFLKDPSRWISTRGTQSGASRPDIVAR